VREEVEGDDVLLLDAVLEGRPQLRICQFCQLSMGWLNEEAPQSIPFTFVTALMFQLPMGWLKDMAWENMPYIFLTSPVCQAPMG
jgi:hypothetical protein